MPQGPRRRLGSGPRLLSDGRTGRPWAGVDEVGRGPLAGPVVAAVVVLDPERPIAGLADSKCLCAAERERLAVRIRDQATAWCVGRAEACEIDALNILQASLLAMARGLALLPLVPAGVQVDGVHAPVCPWPVECIVKGDAKVAAIAAASILAKVERDAEMAILERAYPGYGFARHKGYPTDQHLAALEAMGVCPAHRRSFRPVARVVAETCAG